MTIYLKNNNGQLDIIAFYLASNFLKPLFNFFEEKNYFVYVGCLAEIIDWAEEFYTQYHHKLNNWETFEKSKENVYNAVNKDEFLHAWGNERMNEFFAMHKKGVIYSPRNTANYE